MATIHLKAKLVAAITVLTFVSAPPALSADQPSESPVECVRRTVQRELAAGNGETKAIFVDRKETPHGSQTKLIVETCEGMAGMLIAVNGRQLTPQERQAEDARLSGLASNADQLRKKQKTEKEDVDHTTRIMKALPDAFLYEPDGTTAANQQVGKPGDQLIRLKFRPNPKYSPPSHVEQVLTGMQGYLLIDAAQHRIAKIDGTLTKEVGFGWGILGRLNRGGNFLVEQAEVLPGRWEVTHMSLTFTGKELLFKNLNIKSDEVFSDFRSAPSNLNFAQGVELLKRQEAELAENRQRP
ncbi:MAG TPA: hypothetical protein VNZ03_18130 [Terriglobales bacterium]|nr:hypothetical protein [Terriglobales bacterium]